MHDTLSVDLRGARGEDDDMTPNLPWLYPLLRDRADYDALAKACEGQPESHNVDFKMTYNRQDSRFGDEIAKDVTAMANGLDPGERGVIIVGIAESPETPDTAGSASSQHPVELKGLAESIRTQVANRTVNSPIIHTVEIRDKGDEARGAVAVIVERHAPFFSSEVKHGTTGEKVWRVWRRVGHHAEVMAPEAAAFMARDPDPDPWFTEPEMRLLQLFAERADGEGHLALSPAVWKDDAAELNPVAESFVTRGWAASVSNGDESRLVLDFTVLLRSPLGKTLPDAYAEALKLIDQTAGGVLKETPTAIVQEAIFDLAVAGYAWARPSSVQLQMGWNDGGIGNRGADSSGAVAARHRVAQMARPVRLKPLSLRIEQFKSTGDPISVPSSRPAAGR